MAMKHLAFAGMLTLVVLVIENGPTFNLIRKKQHRRLRLGHARHFGRQPVSSDVHEAVSVAGEVRQHVR
jgi:hypothetical protein